MTRLVSNMYMILNNFGLAHMTEIPTSTNVIASHLLYKLIKFDDALCIVKPVLRW